MQTPFFLHVYLSDLLVRQSVENVLRLKREQQAKLLSVHRLIVFQMVARVHLYQPQDKIIL